MVSPGETFLVLFCTCLLCVTVLDRVLALHKVPFRVRRYYVSKVIAIWCGISMAFLCQFWLNHGNEHQQLSTEYWRLLRNGSVIHTNRSMDHDEHNQQVNNKPVIFITTTDYSVVQPAILTRLGQALYPVRNFVQWIVVSLPLNPKELSQEMVDDENEILKFGHVVTTNDTLEELHVKTLDKVIARFGIPYVILSSRKLVESSWAGHDWPSTTRRVTNGYQTGLLWAFRNLPRGVIMLGDEEFTYNTALFRELQQTRIASCWPVGFGLYDAAMTLPVTGRDMETNKTRIVGYSDGRIYRPGSILIEIGSFAFDLEYFLDNIPYNQYWKLAFNRAFTNKEFNIDLLNIQVLGKEGSEIYVWRTKAVDVSWPFSRINSRRKSLIRDTNVEILLNATLDRRY